MITIAQITQKDSAPRFKGDLSQRGLMTMRHVDLMKRLPTRFTALFLLLLLLGTLLAGCGGGGGGGGGQNNNSGSTIAITGTVVQSGTGSGPLVGWYVVFDGNEKAQTQTGGAFTLDVPSSAITGADTLTVLDPGGNLEGIFQFDFNDIPGNPKPLPNPLTVGPPGPPPNLSRRPS